MLELEKAFLLIVLSLTLWSVFALLLDKRGYAQVNRGFAFLIGCLCIPQIYLYSRLVSPPYGVYWLGISAQAAIWLKGPLLLAMVRLVLGESLQGYWRHFVVFPLALAAMFVWPQWALEMSLAGFFGLSGYLVISLLRLKKNKTRLNIIYKGYPNSAYYWLLFVVIGLLVLVVVDVVLITIAYIQGGFWIEAIRLINWFVSAYLLSIAFFSLYRPNLFFHHGRQQESVEDQPIELVASDKTWRELNDSLAQTLTDALEQQMTKQLFRKNDLSLPELAEALGVSVHQTSELLNVHLGVNFYDYINRYRLAYACQLLSDPKCQLRVLDVAFEAGFSNKNSFYRYFRDAYKMTPVEYRNRYTEVTLKVVG